MRTTRLLALLAAMALAAFSQEETITTLSLTAQESADLAAANQTVAQTQAALDIAKKAMADAYATQSKVRDGIIAAHGNFVGPWNLDATTSIASRTYRRIEVRGGSLIQAAGTEVCSGVLSKPSQNEKGETLPPVCIETPPGRR